MRKIAAVAVRLLLGLWIGMVVPCRAAGVSDLWWNSSESGWGVNVTEQGGILFLTFFVYGQNGLPVWLVAPSTTFQTTNSAGAEVYSGPLYQTTGPYFGGTFNPSAVGVTQVGSVTFTHLTTTTASVSYTVNGTPVNKSLTRQTWASNSYLTGQYMGALVQTSATGCSAAPGALFLNLRIAITGTTLRFTTTNPTTGAQCTTTGAFRQDGAVTTVPSGTVSCTDGTTGTAVLSAIDANRVGVTGRMDFTSGTCRQQITFSGTWQSD